MEKDIRVDFDSLPEMRTKYDKQLKMMNDLMSMKDVELDDDDDDDFYSESQTSQLTEQERDELNKEIQSTVGQSIPNAE